MIYTGSETVELKKSTAELKDAVISIVAMLNKHGSAEVYFGITDDGKIIGHSIGKKTIREVTQAIVDNIEPKIFPRVEIAQINGKECILVKAQGIHGPYFAYGRAYIRVGESDKALSVHEIEKRFLDKKKLLWESERSKQKISEVSEQTLKEFMRKAKIARRIDFDYVGVKTTLHKLNLLDGDYLLRAGEVLFCDVNSLEVQAAIFAGTDKLTFLDIKSFKGNLFSLREQMEVYLYGNLRWRVEIKSGPRKEIPEIPVEALREAIGNSLCHRDYSNPKGNEVAIFKDRVEIYNPGFFPDEINPEDYFTGHEHSVLRNPLIAETMYKSKDIERWGSGIKRIHDECVAAGVKVEFKRLKTGFVVVFYRPNWDAGESIEKGGQKVWPGRVVGKGRNRTVEKTVEKAVEKTVEKIYELVKENPYITQKQIMYITGLSRRGVEWNLAKLKDAGRIKRVGPDKGGYWS